MAGDFNAKSPQWGSRLTTLRGKQLLKAARKINLDCLFAGTPTYWPTDRRKNPDVIDFAIIRNINRHQFKLEPVTDLSSDHSPTLIQLDASTLWRTARNQPKPRVSWKKYQDIFKNKFCPTSNCCRLGKRYQVPPRYYRFYI